MKFPYHIRIKSNETSRMILYYSSNKRDMLDLKTIDAENIIHNLPPSNSSHENNVFLVLDQLSKLSYQHSAWLSTIPNKLQTMQKM